MMRRHLSAELAHNLIEAVNSHAKSSVKWRHWNVGSVVESRSQGLQTRKVFQVNSQSRMNGLRTQINIFFLKALASIGKRL